MRRSEMVNLIWDAINELEDGDYILQIIENAGMLPPTTKRLIGTFPFPSSYEVEANEWEPEDRNLNDLTYEEWRDSNGDD